MNGDKCETPYCRGERELSYLGKWLCDKCWKQHCKEELALESARTEQPIEVRTE